MGLTRKMQTKVLTALVLLSTSMVLAKTTSKHTKKKVVAKSSTTADSRKPASIAVVESDAETTEVQAPTLKPALVTTSPGKSPSAALKMKTSKVPAFEIYQKKVIRGKTEVYRVKNIPRLDVGLEPSFQAPEATALSSVLPPARPVQQLEIAKRTTPPPVDISKWTKNELAAAAPAKSVVPIDPAFSAPVQAPLEPMAALPLTTPKDETKTLEEMTPGQLKMLQALIFLEVQKSYNMALALFAELIDEPGFKTEATYQLALTSTGLGLYSEYKYQMMFVLNDGKKEWQKKAAISLAQSAESGDKALVAILDPRIEQLKIEEIPDADQYNMNRAKYYLDQNNLTLANAAAGEISETSKLALDAQFLKSVILYRGGQLEEAITLQSDVLKKLTLAAPTSELKSQSALTLARMYFQASKYKEAFAAYLQVDKTSAEWTQAMIEQAWSQILAEDYEGAAGNMFSLHTDFFKNAFAPESYVVRTVGYLNLCQYGDGARVIKDMKQRFTPIQTQMDDYSKKMTTDMSHYETIKAFAKNPDQKTVDGLPQSFIFELARHPSFLNEQKLINSAEDQETKYNRITLDLIKKERDILKAQNDVRTQVNVIRKKMDKAKTDEEKAELKSALVFQDKRLLSYKIQHFIAKKARNSIKDLRAQGLVRLEKEKTEFKRKASLAVKNRFEAMRTTLKTTLDQSEVLNYELYAGAGEHIRYQMAGGDISDKDRAELKPEEGKSMKWEFKGEVWQDELGHYRSSLKNVCPRDSVSQLESK
jgi:hypothetical protein